MAKGRTEAGSSWKLRGRLSSLAARTLAGRRSRAEELAQERLDGLRPRRAVVATGGAWSPEAAAVLGASAEVVGVEFAEPGATKAEFGGGTAGRQLAIAEGTEDFADVRGSEAVQELLIVFFIAGKMPERSVGRERAAERSVHL